MKLPTLFIFATLLNTICVFSQNGETNVIHFHELMKTRNASNNLELNGSEFLNPDWVPMKIFMDDGKTFDVPEARINILGGSVDILYKGREMELLTTFVDRVEVMHKGVLKSIMPIYKIKAKDLPEKGFVEVLGNGEDKVLVRYHKYIVKADPNSKILGLDVRPKVMDIEENFIIKNKIAYECKSKKDLKKIYKNKFKKMEELIDLNGINIKNPYSLASLLDMVKDDKDQ